MNKKSTDFLNQYLNNASPTGHESSGQKIWLEYIKDYIDEWHIDNYGTAYAIINPGQEFKVVIEGHADEISWYVNFITDDGFIHVIKNGGSDEVIAPSKRVNIHTKNGMVKVFLAGLQFIQDEVSHKLLRQHLKTYLLMLVLRIRMKF